MRAFLVLVVLTACCLLQALAAKYISFANIRFELVVIAVVFYSLRMDILPAALVGVAGGLLKDVLSLTPLGASAVSLMIVSVVLSWNRRLLSATSAPAQAILVASALISYYLVTGFIEILHGAGPFSVGLVLRYTVPVIIVNVLIAPLCFKVLGFIDHEMA